MDIPPHRRRCSTRPSRSAARRSGTGSTARRCSKGRATVTTWPTRYAVHFVENARHGVGLIVQGSSCIFPEGRTSPGMTCVDTRAKVMRLAPMVDAVHAEGASIFIQLGHGGLYSMEAWHEPYASRRTGPVLAASPVPRVVAARVLEGAGARAVGRRGPRDGDPLRRGRGVDARGGLRRHPARLREREAARPVPLAVLQPPHRRVRRLAREPGAGPPPDPRRGRRARGRRLSVPGEGPGRAAPPGFPHATHTEALRLSTLVEEWGFDAITPVEVSVFPDTTLSRGGVPDAFWTNKGMAARLRAAAPSRRRRAIIKGGAWLGAPPRAVRTGVEP